MYRMVVEVIRDGESDDDSMAPRDHPSPIPPRKMTGRVSVARGPNRRLHKQPRSGSLDLDIGR